MRRSLSPNQFLRMIENRFVSTESKFIDISLWDQCVDSRIGHMVADRTLPIWVGVDASVTHDSTALAAVTWFREQQHVRLVDHRIFTPSTGQQIDFAGDVEQVLLDWNCRFALRAVWYDPYQMASSSQRLMSQGLPMKEYAQTMSNLTAMGENLFQLIKGRNLLVYPDETIRTAVSRAIAIEGPRGWKIAKDKQSHRIDIVIALAMAALACVKDQANPGYDETYAAFQDVDWPGIMLNWYVQTGAGTRPW
jgi:phage terminase large subunit-like protein